MQGLKKTALKCDAYLNSVCRTTQHVTQTEKHLGPREDGGIFLGIELEQNAYDCSPGCYISDASQSTEMIN